MANEKIKIEFSAFELKIIRDALLYYRLKLEKDFKKGHKVTKRFGNKIINYVDMPNGGTYSYFTVEEVEDKINTSKELTQGVLKEALDKYLW